MSLSDPDTSTKLAVAYFCALLVAAYVAIAAFTDHRQHDNGRPSVPADLFLDTSRSIKQR
jgi:hypothetical protein